MVLHILYNLFGGCVPDNAIWVIFYYLRNPGIPDKINTLTWPRVLSIGGVLDPRNGRRESEYKRCVNNMVILPKPHKPFYLSAKARKVCIQYSHDIPYIMKNRETFRLLRRKLDYYFSETILHSMHEHFMQQIVNVIQAICIMKIESFKNVLIEYSNYHRAYHSHIMIHRKEVYKMLGE